MPGHAGGTGEPMGEPTAWRTELRRLHDAALNVDWEEHLAALNTRYGLRDRDALSTADVGLPPAWFNGDVEAIEPGRWVLVVSLNPGKPPAGFYGDELRPDTAWDFWRRHNAGKWWYWRFFRPLVRVAALALDEEVPRAAEPGFATERMVFIELCPYASRRFGLPTETVAELSRRDPGFRTAATFRRILIEEARPALVLVNGAAAVRDAETMDAGTLRWVEVRYESADGVTRKGRAKRLWHKEGTFETTSGSVPVVGFPFLRKPLTHNSDAEIERLGRRIRAFVGPALPDDQAANGPPLTPR